ncbi:MAG: hypothetical protein K0Q48_1561 [Bacillota bacterium]|nr:hypothetical protein [Bacillota bacterium]
MNEFIRTLSGVHSIQRYQSGAVKSCMLSEENKISTCCGELVPRFTGGEARQKFTGALTFYESGEIKRISLESQTMIVTHLGLYPAESLTFYKSGALYRFFPLNGKLSGYWTEQDESALLVPVEIKLSSGSFTAKIIGSSFYENGSLRSVTLWPGQGITLNAWDIDYSVRIGFSLYENGQVKSLEPGNPVSVKTPIGQMIAYDDSALGIHADTNSLCFDEQGEITALATSSHTVRITHPEGESLLIAPLKMPHPLTDDQFIILPMNVIFSKNSVSFFLGTSERRFFLDEAKFELLPQNLDLAII